MADEIPPPIAPCDIICMSITVGKTTAIPASASVPKRLIHHVSTSPVPAWASMTRMFGHDR